MPILHFSGKFSYQLPFYNNKADRNSSSDDKVAFRETLTPEELVNLRKEIGGDFKNYFYFEFTDVKINRVTYDDNSYAEKNEQDAICQSSLSLKAFLADISPHLEYGRLYPIIEKGDANNNYTCLDIKDKTSSTILNAIPGSKGSKDPNDYCALQSELSMNIRTDDPQISEMFRYSASFATKLNDIIIDRSFVNDSRFLQELGDPKQLDLLFYLDKFDFMACTGEISGYAHNMILLDDVEKQGNKKLRLLSRKIVLNQSIDTEHSPIWKDFRLDIDGLHGEYDIIEKSRLLLLRYRNFIPLIPYSENGQIDYLPPRGYTYLVYFTSYVDNNLVMKIGEFNFDLFKATNSSDNRNWLREGGIIIFNIPKEAEQIFTNNNFYLKIQVIKKITLGRENEIEDSDDARVDLMVEQPFDLILERDQDRGMIMDSGQTKQITAKVYHKNQPKEGHKVYLTQDDLSQRKNSPIVVEVKEKELSTDKEGKINATINALNLENLPHEIYDPVDRKYYGKTESEKFLPWDRYYGNFVYLKIKENEQNDRSFIQEAKIAVRVLHIIRDLDQIPLNEIENYVFKLFDYYTRYYPWLHVKIGDNNKYKKYLDFRVDADDLVSKIITRLEMDINNKKKMPRSRDFPTGGLELLKRWYQEILLAGR